MAMNMRGILKQLGNFRQGSANVDIQTDKICQEKNAFVSNLSRKTV